MIKTKIESKEVAKKLGSYSHGYSVEVGDAKIIFTTGQIALDKDGNVAFPDDVEKQTEFIFESLQNILQEAGASLDDVIKATICVTNLKDFPKISPIRNKYFKNSEPASTLVEVNKLVKDGCKIEIEVVAIKEAVN